MDEDHPRRQHQAGVTRAWAASPRASPRPRCSSMVTIPFPSSTCASTSTTHRSSNCGASGNSSALLPAAQERSDGPAALVAETHGTHARLDAQPPRQGRPLAVLLPVNAETYGQTSPRQFIDAYADEILNFPGEVLLPASP